MLGVATDVTARKRAEADSETLAALVQSSDDAIIGKTLDGRIVTWNRGAERVFGYAADEVKGRTVGILFPREQRHEWTAILERVRRGEAVESAGVRVRKDGRPIEVATTVSPIRDGGGRLVGASTIARDVTAWRRHERQVANLQALTDAALAHHSVDALLGDLLGRLCAALEADVATVLLLSEDGQTLVVRASHGLPQQRGATVSIERGVAGRILRTAHPVVIEDLSQVEIASATLRPSGLVSLLGMRLVVERRMIGVVHVATTTPHRFTDDDIRLLRLAADRMALALDHARLFEAELAARAEAEAANRTKDQFLATLSHELRTPLTAMLGWVRMLRSGRLDAAGSARALETIERSTRAQAQLINDLLDISRIVSGKLTMDLVPVDAGDVVQAAIDAARPLAEAKAIALDYQPPSEPVTVNADAGRLQQVVSNLVTNAIKFTPDAGRVAVEVEQAEGEITIRVADTGKGIAPELLPEIFERFRQGTATRAQGGLGLGLAIVRHLVELHGGRVGAESPGPGLGATFSVTLPCGDDAQASRTVRREAGGDFPRLDGVRVLVVDDEPDARTLIGTVLGQCGADVATVDCASAALAALERDRWDVLLSDISMPEEDGYQLIRKVRARDVSIPAAAVTAFARAEDRDAALAAGFQMHVTKPLEPVLLARAVEALAKRAA
jgi:PAS domain S-box-containing protein